MNLLAIDTSSNACSVAVQVGDENIEKHVVEPREHTKILLPMIEGLLQEAGVALSDLDAVVLGNGPGSFIGMRIGASVAQGICHGAGLRIVPVSSLAAIAAEVICEHGAEKILVAQDARMHEIYLGRFHADAGGLPQADNEEVICGIGPLTVPDAGYVAAGAGWNRYPELLAQNSHLISATAEVIYPRARYLLQLGVNAKQAGRAIPPDALVPAYIRSKVADIPV
ncbi:MAG: tRNA (adenosine(37)-N6)-threonylcarbamoyltransferase complex dimerization subunit type 1 TsaB [Proteobacteria bacterium]|nr:tRNA (adenosine(37)-N6)-threonylcarbamoyltransferase complex dimerization subunit type 1 TsaB [Pseudomonadota bacterium]